VFSVAPEPTVSQPTRGPRSAPARAEPSTSDGFSVLLDGNAGSERPANPAPDAPPKRPPAAEARSRSDAAPTPKSPPATDAMPDAAGAPADAAATTDPAAGAPPSTPQIEALADATTITPDDAATSDDPAPTADADIAALETAVPVVVIPLMVAAEDAAPTGDAASAGAAAEIDGSAGRASAVLRPADAVPIQTSAAEAALAGLPSDADAPASTEADAAMASAPANGKTKAKVAPVTTDAGTSSDVRPADADAAAPASDPSEPDGAPHGTQHAETKHGARQAETSTAQDVEKPALRPAADHRTPVTAAASPDVAIDPALHTTGQTAQPLHIQTPSANAAAAPAPQLNVMAAGTMAVPLNGLAMDIALRAAGGSSRFEIRLDPAELGRIDVRLDVDKHGNVTSHLTVERPATLDMLRNDAPRLQQALEDAGLKTGDGGLQFSLRDQSSSGRQDDGQSGRAAQRLVITEDDPVPPQIAGRSYGRMLGASGGVDIRV